MRKRDDPDLVVQICIDNKEGKTTGEVSPSFVFTKWPSIGKLANCMNGSFNFGCEIEAKPWRLLFVIRDYLPELYLSLVQDDGWDH
jgi:hypothetical protein